jgi:hypothetical protein
MKKSKISFILLLIICSIYGVNSDSHQKEKKIDELNVLLPLLFDNSAEGKDRAIVYRVNAYNGCYKWTSEKSNYLKAEGVSDITNKKCQNTCILKPTN